MSPKELTELLQLIASLREQLAEMDDNTRRETIDMVAEGYCHWCGSDEGLDCQCMNDE